MKNDKYNIEEITSIIYEICIQQEASADILNIVDHRYFSIVFYYAYLCHWKNEKGFLSQWPLLKVNKGIELYEQDDILESVPTLKTKPVFLSKERENSIKVGIIAANNLIKAEGSIDNAMSYLTSHSISWKKCGERDEIAICLDTLTDDEYDMMKKKQEPINKMVNEVFKK